MGMNNFAPGVGRFECFTVLNISSNPRKTIKIFNEPINWMGTRDLLRIRGIAEGEIKSSLLKGTLNLKIRAGEIVVLCSDIDLNTFDVGYQNFLLSTGIMQGVVPGGSGSGITADQHQSLRQLIHFVDQGPTQGFGSSAYKIVTGGPFPTDISWFLDAGLTKRLVQKIIGYNANKTVNFIIWNMYDTDGVTIIHQLMDTFVYTNGVFESERIRTIAF